MVDSIAFLADFVCLGGVEQFCNMDFFGPNLNLIQGQHWLPIPLPSLNSAQVHRFACCTLHQPSANWPYMPGAKPTTFWHSLSTHLLLFKSTQKTYKRTRLCVYKYLTFYRLIIYICYKIAFMKLSLLRAFQSYQEHALSCYNTLLVLILLKFHDKIVQYSMTLVSYV